MRLNAQYFLNSLLFKVSDKKSLSCSNGDLPHSNQVVSVASKQGLSISRPCQGGALWGFSLAVCADDFLSQFIHNDLAFQIPDLDARACGSTEPVTVGTEAESIDGITTVQGVQVLALV